VSDLTAIDAVLDRHTALPRDNGELVFEMPWQGRALGMGVVALENVGASWADFREYLVQSIADHPPNDHETAATTYYAAWLNALERLLADRDQSIKV